MVRTVLVSYSKYNDPYIAMFGAIDSVLIQTLSGIQLNDGTLGGLVTVEALVTKLNNLENIVNDLITLYNTHVHTANNTPTVSVETDSLTPTERADIENTTVNHGI